QLAESGERGNRGQHGNDDQQPEPPPERLGTEHADHGPDQAVRAEWVSVDDALRLGTTRVDEVVDVDQVHGHVVVESHPGDAYVTARDEGERGEKSGEI